MPIVSWDPNQKLWVPSPPAPGSITTPMLASHAVTFPHFVAATTLNPTTTSTTFVNLPDMTLSFTTTVVTDIYVWLASALSNNTAGANMVLGINLDGTDYAQMFVSAPLANAAVPGNTFYVFAGVAAGAHTINGRWNAGSGTATAPVNYRYLGCLEARA